jgi:hypothetical protein
MLEFKEVTYLYKLTIALVRANEEIYTSEGYVHLDYDRGYYWNLLIAPSGVPIPWHFLKEDSTLYIMREEPNFYA